MDLTTATPVEIDTVLKALYEESIRLGHRISMAVDTLHYRAGDKRRYEYYGNGSRSRQVWGMSLDEVLAKVEEKTTQTERPWEVRDAQQALDDYRKAVADLDANKAAQVERNAEFRRRGGWTRAFLAVGQGELHVHSSMDCSTCNKGFEPTRFDWRTEFSGGTESDVVEASGERACTVCYPSAPVEVLNRPSTIFSPDEVAKKAAREEREAKRAAAQAEQVVVPDFPVESYRTREIRTEEKVFKTLRAATQAASSARADVLSWRADHPSAAVWTQTAEAVERAIAEKTGTPLAEVQADIAKRAAAAHKRRG